MFEEGSNELRIVTDCAQLLVDPLLKPFTAFQRIPGYAGAFGMAPDQFVGVKVDARFIAM